MRQTEIMPSRTRIIFTGFVGLATIILAIAVRSTLANYKVEHNFHDQINSPVLALELACDKIDLDTVLAVNQPVEQQLQVVPRGPCRKPEAQNPCFYTAAQHEAAVNSLHANTMLDLLFIPAYATFLWLVAGLFAGPHTMLRKLARAAAIFAAIADYIEDFGIFRSLSASTLSDVVALHIRYPSLVKWGLIAAALLVIAIIMLCSSVRLYSLAARRLFGLTFAVAGSLMLAGLFQHSLIELSLEMFGLIVLANTFSLFAPTFAELLPGLGVEYVTDFCQRRRLGQQPKTAIRPFLEDSTGKRSELFP